jgi:hypothetical protein
MTAPLTDRERLARELCRWWFDEEGNGNGPDDATEWWNERCRQEASFILSMLGKGKKREVKKHNTREPKKCEACDGGGTYISSEIVEGKFVKAVCPWCRGTGIDIP